MNKTLFLTIDCEYHLEQKFVTGFNLKLGLCAPTNVELQKRTMDVKTTFRRASGSDVSAIENAMLCYRYI